MGVVSPCDSRGQPISVRIKRPGDRRSCSRTATRALDVLEYFGVARRPLRAFEIARTIGMSPSSTNQLLKTMVDSAHLIFNMRTMTYLPSPRLVGFSDWLVSTYGADEGLRRLVREVQAHTGMTTTLTTANDIFMQILELATIAEPSGERGQRISVFGSAIGSAYLSMLDDGEVRRLAVRARLRDDDVDRVLQDIMRIRADGYADTANALPPDADGTRFWSIAVPLTDSSLPVRLVLGLAGPQDRVEPRRDALLACMRNAIGCWARSRDEGDRDAACEGVGSGRNGPGHRRQ